MDSEKYKLLSLLEVLLPKLLQGNTLFEASHRCSNPRVSGYTAGFGLLSSFLALHWLELHLKRSHRRGKETV